MQDDGVSVVSGQVVNNFIIVWFFSAISDCLKHMNIHNIMVYDKNLY